MRRFAVSIRHQLLLLGALATGSIWVGALLQTLHLSDKAELLEQVRQDVDAAKQFAEVWRYVAQERGLTYGWLLQQPQPQQQPQDAVGRDGPTELADARRKTDLSLAQLAQLKPTADTAATGLPVSIAARADQLPRLRSRIDRRDLPADEAFRFFSGFVEVVQDTAARRQADGMVAVALPYEHVAHLNRAAELLAQLRGQVNGALRAGSLSPSAEAELIRELAFYEDALRLYERSQGHAAPAAVANVRGPAVRATVEHVVRLLQEHDLAALALDANGWWTLATEAVDTLQQAALFESVQMAEQADARIAQVERRLIFSIAALVVLGIVTLALVLSTVQRIFNGLNRLLDGMETVGSGRDFGSRIDASGRDEFGAISSGINKLIEVADSLVIEQQRLSLTDPLTGMMNRCGFDQQLAARTTARRAHSGPMALLLLDIDHFKAINDSFGYAGGDLVLRGMAQVLAAALRPDDVLARFNGQTFAMLLPGCTLFDAVAVAEKLRSAAAAHDFGVGRPLTVSVGVAQFVREQNPETLLALADAHLQAAKAAGRDRVMPLLQSLHVAT